MSSRKDQLHSYQFMMQRVVSSIISHETDPEQMPLRRGVGAAFAGVMIAGLVTVVFGIIGVVTNVGGDSWRADGAVIIERETGATYVYRSGDVLQPVLNYASARLIGGQSGAGQHRVAGRGLADIPRRVTVGIPGAPDSLPERDRIAGAPWTMCSVPGEDASGALVTTTTLMIGNSLPGGRVLSDEGLLVRDEADGTHYLIWRSHRHPIVGDDPEGVIRSLYGARTVAVEVGTAWLNGLPTGQEIGPIRVSKRGSESSAMPRHEIGDVLSHPVSGGVQHYLVLDDGLTPVTDLQVRILDGQYPLDRTQVSATVANTAASSAVVLSSSGETAPPSQPPELLPLPPSGTGSLCSMTNDAGHPPSISFGGDLAAIAAGIETTGVTGSGTKLADRVLVPPGGIAVVEAMPSATATSGSFALVTDVGLRFPVPSPEELGALGYQPADAVRMPAALVRRIPEGPTLDVSSAGQPAPVSGPEG